MTKINARQIDIRTGGNYSTLEALLDQKTVFPLPFVEAQKLTITGAAQFGLISSTILAGTIAKGVGTATLQGGIVAAALVGAVGTAATTSIADSNGSILNLVEIIDDTTNDPLVNSAGQKIWGLIQCSNGAADGAAVGASGSENLQISFVVYDNASVLQLSALDPTVAKTIQFHINKIYALRYRPTLMKDGAALTADVLDPSTKLAQSLERRLVVSTVFPTNAVITLTTGAGSPSGAATTSGDTLLLPASAGLFSSDARVQVHRNGVQQKKGVDVVYDSTNSLHFADILDVNDEITVFVPPLY